MENSKATTYTTAKKSIGCKEPAEVKDLVFIETDFGFLNIGYLLAAYYYHKVVLIE